MAEDFFSGPKERFAIADIRDDTDRLTALEVDECLAAYLTELSECSDPHLSLQHSHPRTGHALPFEKMQHLTANEERLIAAAFMSVSSSNLHGLPALQAVLERLNIASLPASLVLRVARECHIAIPGEEHVAPLEQHVKASSVPPHVHRESASPSPQPTGRQMLSSRSPRKLASVPPIGSGKGLAPSSDTGMLSQRATSPKAPGSESARKLSSGLRHFQGLSRSCILSARRTSRTARTARSFDHHLPEQLEDVLSLGTVQHAIRLLKQHYYGPHFQREAEALGQATVADVFVEAEMRYSAGDADLAQSPTTSSQSTARFGPDCDHRDATTGLTVNAAAVKALLNAEFGLGLPDELSSQKKHLTVDSKNVDTARFSAKEMLRSDSFWNALNTKDTNEAGPGKRMIEVTRSASHGDDRSDLELLSFRIAAEREGGPSQAHAVPSDRTPRGSLWRVEAISPELDGSPSNGLAGLDESFTESRNDLPIPGDLATRGDQSRPSTYASDGPAVFSIDSDVCDCRPRPQKGRAALLMALRQRNESIRARAEQILREKLQQKKRSAMRTVKDNISCPKSQQQSEEKPKGETIGVASHEDSLSSFASHPQLYSTHGNSNIYLQGTASLARRSGVRKDIPRGRLPPGTYASGVRGPILARFFEGLCTDAFLAEASTK
jgi:hypothetical protein